MLMKLTGGLSACWRREHLLPYITVFSGTTSEHDNWHAAPTIHPFVSSTSRPTKAENLIHYYYSYRGHVKMKHKVTNTFTTVVSTSVTYYNIYNQQTIPPIVC